MELKFAKTNPLARLPEYATPGAAALDFFLPQEYRRDIDAKVVVVEAGYQEVFSLGLKVEVPEGFVLMLYSRSGQGFNHSVVLGNGTGVIDSDYRGELKVCLRNNGKREYKQAVDKAIMQGILMPIPRVTVAETTEDQLSTTLRGEGGLGSTDRTGTIFAQTAAMVQAFGGVPPPSTLTRVGTYSTLSLPPEVYRVIHKRLTDACMAGIKIDPVNGYIDMSGIVIVEETTQPL